MRHLRYSSYSILVAGALACAVSSPAKAQTTALGRQLAPGVLKTIPPETEKGETFSGPREFVELYRAAPQWKPNLEPATVTLTSITKQMTFRRGIWQLEFSFKPVRMLEDSGSDLVWYMVYRVRNLGQHLKPELKDKADPNSGYEINRVDYPIRFFPVFELVDHEHGTRYIDQVVPWAVKRIHDVELRDPRIELRNSVEMTRVAAKVSSDEVDRGLWGVAIWKGVDPRTDFFSVYVRGLTNAYQWEDQPDAFQPGDPPSTGRRFTYKTLQLNFWRPGDTVRETDDRIRYGMPLVSRTNTKLAHFNNLYGVSEPTNYLWRYLPPIK